MKFIDIITKNLHQLSEEDIKYDIRDNKEYPYFISPNYQGVDIFSAANFAAKYKEKQLRIDEEGISLIKDINDLDYQHATAQTVTGYCGSQYPFGNFFVQTSIDTIAAQCQISASMVNYGPGESPFTGSDAITGSGFFISGGAENNEFFISSSNFNVKASGDITGSQVLFQGGKIAAFNLSKDALSTDSFFISASATGND